MASVQVIKEVGLWFYSLMVIYTDITFIQFMDLHANLRWMHVALNAYVTESPLHLK